MYFFAAGMLGGALLLPVAGSAQAISVGPGAPPTTLSGEAGGPIHAALMNSDCTGQVGELPDHVIEVTADTALVLTVQSASDSTLMILGPGGTWCNDDTNGLNAAVQAPFAAGTYSVFVGSYQGDAFPYTLTVSAGGGEAIVPTEIPPTPAPASIAVGAALSPDPMSLTGSVAPTQSASATFGPNCAGFVGTAPDHVFNLTAAQNYLRFTAESSTDLTLALRGPGGVLCNDDTHGFDPEISGPFAPGEYQLFVGTYSSGTAANYALTVATQPHGAAGAAIPTNTNGQAIELAPGFSPDPQVAVGVSGGTVSASDYGTTPTGPCRGTIAAAPNHVFVLQQAMPYLRFTVEAPHDTTLVIRGPEGVRCQDDSFGFNPEITGAMLPGRYEVFVGSYSTDGDYALRVSSRPR
jgi:hypothetical protein